MLLADLLYSATHNPLQNTYWQDFVHVTFTVVLKVTQSAVDWKIHCRWHQRPIEGSISYWLVFIFSYQYLQTVFHHCYFRRSRLTVHFTQLIQLGPLQIERQKKATYSKPFQLEDRQEVLIDEESDGKLEQINKSMKSCVQYCTLSEDDKNTNKSEATFQTLRAGDKSNIVGFLWPQCGLKRSAVSNINVESSPFSIFSSISGRFFKSTIDKGNHCYYQCTISKDTRSTEAQPADVTIIQTYVFFTLVIQTGHEQWMLQNCQDSLDVDEETVFPPHTWPYSMHLLSSHVVRSHTNISGRFLFVIWSSGPAKKLWQPVAFPGVGQVHLCLN